MADIGNDITCERDGCGHMASGHADVADGQNSGACQMSGCDCPAMMTGAGSNSVQTVTLAADDMMPADGEPGAPGGPPDEDGIGWTAPVFIPEGAPTSDGRMIDLGALSARVCPLPLWQMTDGPHGDTGPAPIVGRIDLLTRDSAGVWTASGVFEDTAEALELVERIRGGFVTGISADLAVTGLELRVTEVDEDGNILAATETVTAGEIIGGTIVPDPAFAEAQIILEPAPDGTDVLDPLQPGDAIPILLASAAGRIVNDPLCAPCTASLRASAGVADPPADWFTDPLLDGPTPLTITDDGRIYGHLAVFGQCHTGVSGQCVTAPRSLTGYAYFRTGAVRCADGTDVATGPITMSTGHAGMAADATTAVAHYDHTGTAVADVAAGEDTHGIWVAGATRPGISAGQVRILRGSALSGDWRRIGSSLELVAALAVNTPGFPIARVASGVNAALVAAGAVSVARRATPWRAEVSVLRDEVAALRRERAASQLLARIHGR